MSLDHGLHCCTFPLLGHRERLSHGTHGALHHAPPTIAPPPQSHHMRTTALWRGTRPIRVRTDTCPELIKPPSPGAEFAWSHNAGVCGCSSMCAGAATAIPSGGADVQVHVLQHPQQAVQQQAAAQQRPPHPAGVVLPPSVCACMASIVGGSDPAAGASLNFDGHRGGCAVASENVNAAVLCTQCAGFLPRPRSDSRRALSSCEAHRPRRPVIAPAFALTCRSSKRPMDGPPHEPPSRAVAAKLHQSAAVPPTNYIDAASYMGTFLSEYAPRLAQGEVRGEGELLARHEFAPVGRERDDFAGTALRYLLRHRTGLFAATGPTELPTPRAPRAAPAVALCLAGRPIVS